MKQLKPFMFWIVCGVIVLIELGFLIFWQETDDAGHTPEQVKQSFDTVYKNLTDLYTRAQQHDPEGEFDAENHQDMKRLTSNYLITEAWKQRLQPVVDKYNKQREDIHGDLVQRSACLHVPIYPDDDPSNWYDNEKGYLGKSKELLTNLKAANALALSGDEKQADLDTNIPLRNKVGLYTRVKDYPDPKDHPNLSLQFTIIDRISQAVIKAKAKPDPNPVLGKLVPEPQEGVAQMVSLIFEGSNQNNNGVPKPVTQVTAAPINLTLTLEGPIGLLIAAEAEIENISEPVMIVRGGRLSAKSGWRPGERKGVSVDTMTCVINITVLDFTLTPTAPAATSQSGPPGRPDLAPGHVPNQFAPPGLPGQPGQTRPPSLNGVPVPSLPGQGPKP